MVGAVGPRRAYAPNLLRPAPGYCGTRSDEGIESYLRLLAIEQRPFVTDLTALGWWAATHDAASRSGWTAIAARRLFFAP